MNHLSDTELRKYKEKELSSEAHTTCACSYILHCSPFRSEKDN